MFLPFLLRLLGGSVFPLFLLSVLSTPVFGVDALSLPKRGKGPVGLSIGLMVIRVAAQTYIWFGWAAYCAALALRYTESPWVDNSIVYYGAAFIAANLPITFLALKESAVTESDGGRNRIQRGTAFYRVVTLTAFMIFCISPQLMRGSYGWMVESIVPSDRRIEVAELLREAIRGDADAQHNLAIAYAEGRLVAGDRVTAKRLNDGTWQPRDRATVIPSRIYVSGCSGRGGLVRALGRRPSGAPRLQSKATLRRHFNWPTCTQTVMASRWIEPRRASSTRLPPRVVWSRHRSSLASTMPTIGTSRLIWSNPIDG